MSGLSISASNNVVVNSHQVNGNKTCPSVPAQNSYPNLAPLDKDTVSFKEQNTTQKKKGMSTFGKICLGLLGVGAVAYAGVVTHRIKTKPTIDKVAQNFSEIFRKDVSKEEAQKIIEKYRKIYAINEPEEYVKTLFEEAKKDYGFEKADIPLKINYLNKDISLSECMGQKRAGGFNSIECEIVLDLPCRKGDKLNNLDKRNLADTIFHELRHSQQHQMSYFYDKNALLEAFEKNHLKDDGNIDKMIKDFKSTLSSKSKLKEQAKIANTTPEKLKTKLEGMLNILEKRDDTAKILAGKLPFDKTKVLNNYSRAFDNVPHKDLSGNANEIKAYITNISDYKKAGDVGMQEYKAQILESDAFAVGSNIKKLFDSFASMWRLPYFM